jgi:hypothetical protein
MNDRKCSFCQLEFDDILELSTHLKMEYVSETAEMMKQRADMSNSTDSYYYRTHLRVQHTKIIPVEEKALLDVETQANKLHRLNYMENSLIDIQESIKDLWNEIRQAAQANAGTNRVYLKWLEKRIKAKHDDDEEKERKLSSESEKEEESEEDDEEEDNTEDLRYTKSEPVREHVSDNNATSYSGPKQIPKVLDKRPARPGR